MAAAHLRAPIIPAPAEPHVRGCTGKIGYGTQAEARVMLRSVGRGGPRVALTDPSTACYRCRHCARRHLTRRNDP